MKHTLKPPLTSFMGSCLSGRRRLAALTSAEQEEVLLLHTDLRTALHLSEKDFLRLHRYVTGEFRIRDWPLTRTPATFSSFQEANLNGDGVIQLGEFLSFFEVERTRFTTRVFDMFCDGNDGIVRVSVQWKEAGPAKLTMESACRQSVSGSLDSGTFARPKTTHSPCLRFNCTTREARVSWVREMTLDA